MFSKTLLQIIDDFKNFDIFFEENITNIRGEPKRLTFYHSVTYRSYSLQMIKAKYLTAAVLATLAGSVWASTTYITVSVPAPMPSIHPLGNLYFPSSPPVEQPKLWMNMSARERAELWPHLSLRMQRHYWTCMSRAERRAMYKFLPPKSKLALRHRFVFQDHKFHGGPVPPHLADNHTPPRPPRLSPEARKRLRAQVKDVREMDRPMRDRIPR